MFVFLTPETLSCVPKPVLPPTFFYKPIGSEPSGVNEESVTMRIKIVPYLKTLIIFNTAHPLCLTVSPSSSSSWVVPLYFSFGKKYRIIIALMLSEDIVIDNNCLAHWSARGVGWEQYESLAMTSTLLSIIIYPLFLQARDVSCLEVRVDTGKLKQQSTSEVIASLAYCSCVVIQSL